jgi:hypothetical protein
VSTVMPPAVLDTETGRMFLHCHTAFHYNSDGEPTGLTAEYTYLAAVEDLPRGEQ